MPVKQGAYLGSVRDIATLRDRCVIGLDGCWHLRSPRVRPMPANGTCHQLWIHDVGKVSVPRAVHYLATGEWVPHAYRACRSYDCAAPAHIRAGPRVEQGKVIATDGRARGKHRVIAAHKAASTRGRRIPQELVAWIRESRQPSGPVAQAIGCSRSYVIAIRAGVARKPPPRRASVFDMLEEEEAA